MIEQRNPLLDGFFQHLQSQPDAIAARDIGGKSWTFRDVFLFSEQYFVSYKTAGVQTGDRVLILHQANIDLLAAILAMLRLGASLVLADPGMGRDVFLSRITSSKPKWVMRDPALTLIDRHPLLRWILEKRGTFLPRMRDMAGAKRLPEKEKTHVLQQSPEALRLSIRHQPPMADDQEQAVVFTSGTTAKPKGVIHTIGSLGRSLDLIHNLCEFQNHSLVLTSLPYFLLIALASGVGVIIAPTPFQPARWQQALLHLSPTHIFAAPTEMGQVVERLIAAHQKLPTTVQQIMLGSAPVTRAVLERAISVADPHTQIIGIYGMTEVLPIATIDGRKKVTDTKAGDLLGALMPNIQARTADDGELYVTAPHMSPAYLDQPPHAAIATGDIVSFDQHELRLQARKKDMIIRGNYNIYPRLYESTIERIPGVAACAMIGIWDEGKSDERIVLAIEPQPGYSHIIETVKKSLKRPEYSIDEHAWPDEFVSMTLPRKDRQAKLDRPRLKAIIRHRV